MRAVFAIPGDLAHQSGGYAYARRILREAPWQGLELTVQALPDGFPHPTPSALVDTATVLAELPPGTAVMVDGLAFGAFTEEVIEAIQGPVLALCHHPLALEAGLSPDTSAALRRSERRALGMADHVLTTSHATAAILTRDYGVDGARLTVAQPGTDPAPRVPPRLREGCRILSVGSVIPRKGHVGLVEALSTIADQDWTLSIVGAWPDDAEHERLSTAIAEHGLDERITLTGPLEAPEVADAYQDADLFVLASEYEGFGMAFSEAMAHGLPVLGLHSEAVEEATAGAARLVDPQDLAEALGALVADPDARTKLADRCWIAAQTLMRWPQTTAIIARVIGEAGK